MIAHHSIELSQLGSINLLWRSVVSRSGRWETPSAHSSQSSHPSSQSAHSAHSSAKHVLESKRILRVGSRCSTFLLSGSSILHRPHDCPKVGSSRRCSWCSSAGAGSNRTSRSSGVRPSRSGVSSSWGRLSGKEIWEWVGSRPSSSSRGRGTSASAARKTTHAEWVRGASTLAHLSLHLHHLERQSVI